MPKLQTVGWVCQFLNRQRGFAIPSSAAFGKIGAAYVGEVHRWAEANDVPVVHFKKGENKEAIARPLLDAAAAEGGGGRVVLVGIAQEKAPVWRSWTTKGQEHVAHPHMEWGRQMAFINHFYFYLWDPEWGAAFLEDQRLCAVSDLDLAQRAHLGAAAVRQGRDRVHRAGQRIPLLR